MNIVCLILVAKCIGSSSDIAIFGSLMEDHFKDNGSLIVGSDLHKSSPMWKLLKSQIWQISFQSGSHIK